MSGLKFESTTEKHCVAYSDSTELAVLKDSTPIVAFHDDDPKGVYGRSVYYPERKPDSPVCYQYLLVWDEQVWPPHPMDYAPIFVYKTGGEYSTIVYDKGHYVAGRYNLEIDQTPCLDVANAWHSFKVIKEDPGDVIPQSLLPLTDELITEWWRQEDKKARLKILNKLRDPFRLIGSNYFDDPPFSAIDRFFKKITPMVPKLTKLTKKDTSILEIIERESRISVFESYSEGPSDQQKESILEAIRGPEFEALSGKALRSLDFPQLPEIAQLLEGEIGD
ncbi:MAG: hypothetical protein ACXABL_11680 [Candidatus Thorarchaeota archaeon]|jgi:hypothetical protein